MIVECLLRKDLTLRCVWFCGSVILSGSLEKSSGWIYRTTDRRAVTVKSINEEVRKIAVLDSATRVPFAIDVPKEFPLSDMEVDKEYYAMLKVFSAKKVDRVAPDFMEFFSVVDVDQLIEDFIKAYWLYPKLIKFELAEAEPI